MACADERVRGEPIVPVRLSGGSVLPDASARVSRKRASTGSSYRGRQSRARERRARDCLCPIAVARPGAIDDEIAAALCSRRRRRRGVTQAASCLQPLAFRLALTRSTWRAGPSGYSGTVRRGRRCVPVQWSVCWWCSSVRERRSGQRDRGRGCTDHRRARPAGGAFTLVVPVGLRRAVRPASWCSRGSSSATALGARRCGG